ncbi:MAG: outer membrane beta-barrel protein [Deltaproteobacteria bacterium]
MRTLRIFLVGALLCFNMSTLLSQTDNVSQIKAFGIGLHLEQFKSSDLFNGFEGMGAFSGNKIIMVFSPSKSFRIEPEIGFTTISIDEEDEKFKFINLGLGVLGMVQHNKLNIYGGLRAEYGLTKFGSDSDDKFSNFSISPTLGTEYYLGENFSFGGEFALKYSSTEQFEDSKIKFFSTSTGLFIRFYF